jgi:competence protein ComEC
MSRLDSYPGVAALAFLCAGIWLAGPACRSLGQWSAFTLASAVALVCFVAARDVGVYLRLAAAFFFFVLGFHLGCADLLRGEAYDPPLEKQAVHATVWKLWASGPAFRVILVENGSNATTGAALPGLGRLVVRDNETALNAGDRVAFRGRIRKPQNRGNPGEYDWETDCKHNGIHWLASVKGSDGLFVLTRGGQFTPNALLFSFRQRMDRFLDEHGGVFLARFNERLRKDTVPHVRAFHKGVILGDLGEVDSSLTKAFADSGLAHVLSASGLHVGIVVLLTAFLVKVFVRLFPQVQLWLPFKKLCALASIPSVVIYCLLVGARVPAIRSMIMGVVIAGAILVDRRWNSFNTLALAALIILLLYPVSLFTPSFQLSFTCVAGIFIVVPELTRALRLGSQNDLHEAQTPGKPTPMCGRMLRYVTVVLVTSVAATLAVTPLLLQNFRSFPVYTLASNIATDFMLAPALSIGLIACVVGTLFPGIGAALLIPADVLVWAVIEIAYFFAGLPCSSLRISHMGPLGFAVCAGIALVSLWFLRAPSSRRFRVLALSGTLLISIPAVAHLARPDSQELVAVFLNVGKGDAAFVQPPGCKGLLIDAGIRTEYFDSGRNIVNPFLDWTGRRSLDAIAFSHSHIDHIGGGPSVMLHAPPSALWWNPAGLPPKLLEDILALARERNTAIVSGTRTCELQPLGQAIVRFLNREAPNRKELSHKDVNNASLVFRLEYGHISMLFTGDLEQEGEAELLASGLPLSSTILKVGHHGGKGSSSPDFVRAVRPKIAIISADYPRHQSVPDVGVIERLKSVGAEVFWTGRDGAVTVRTDGKTVRVTTGRESADGEKMGRREFRETPAIP